MIRIKDIRISINAKEHDLKKAIAKKLAIRIEEVIDYKIYKKSIDARKKNDILIVYTLDANINNEERFFDLKIEEECNTLDELEMSINRKSNVSPVIVGAGPCGLFCAYLLALKGFNPIVIEQGKMAKERQKDVEEFWNNRKFNPISNVQFGLGGAGTFSDGKLTTLINDPLCKLVLEQFVQCGAPEEILYEAKPHLGTDNLVEIVENLKDKIIELGGKFIFNEKVVDIVTSSNDELKIKEVITDKGNHYETDTLVLAIGHSSRDTFELLKEKEFNIIPKPFSVGVRVEHLQEDINKSQYGPSYKNELLGAADYKLVYHGKYDDGKEERSAYTFCMCPGGVVVASTSEEGKVVTNGMSYFKRDGVNANSAVLVSVNPSDFEGDDVLRGMYFQRDLEQKAFVAGGSNYNAPVQTVDDYENNKLTTKLGKVIPTYKPGYKFANFNDIFPEFINRTLKEGLRYFGRKIAGFDSKDAIMTGVETRSSSPIRIVRDETLMSNVKGVYPAGEGAGYAGGIMSSAVDGLKVAMKILEND